MAPTTFSVSLNELILSALDSITSPPEQALSEHMETPSSKHAILGDMPIAARWLHNLSIELTEQVDQAHKEFCDTEDYSAEESAARLKRDQLINRMKIVSELKWALLRDSFPQHKNFLLLRDWKVAKASVEGDVDTMSRFMEIDLQQIMQQMSRQQRRR